MAKFIWNTSVKDFLKSVGLSDFISQLQNNYFLALGEHPDIKQVNAWKSSLNYLGQRLVNTNDNLQLILEYQLPYSGDRIDAILIGKDKNGKPTALVIEFKGWNKAKAITSYQVDTDMGKQVHPDYQLANYIGKLHYSHSSSDSYNFIGATVIYNLERDKCDLNFKNNVFFKREENKFEKFILDTFEGAVSESVLNEFIYGEYTQNKKLFSAIREYYEEIKEASHFALAEKGFGLSNDQLEIIEEIKTAVMNNEKITFLIQGAPGSGKTLLAIHLLINSLRLNKRTLLGYRNNRLINSLRNIFNNIQPGLDSAIKFYSVGPRIGSNGIAEKNFRSTPLDLVIYDEAQRMTKENIKFAMQRSNVQVFLFDEKQILNAEEEGTLDNFRSIANNLSLTIKEKYLNGYHRIAGGESYHNWIEGIISPTKNNTANLLWKEKYDFQVFDDFGNFLSSLRSKAINNRVALLASFTESPGDSKNPESIENLRVGYPLHSGFDHYKNNNFRIYWLMDPKNDYVPFWVNGDCNKLEKCASIYGCQGFEADYIGLIWGRDYVISNGKWCLGDSCEDTIGSPSLKKIISDAKNGDKEKITEAFKLLINRYRIFLTRGMKGTYIYFEDEETKKYVVDQLQAFC